MSEGFDFSVEGFERFTPEARGVLERALREALCRGSREVCPEDIECALDRAGRTTDLGNAALASQHSPKWLTAVELEQIETRWFNDAARVSEDIPALLGHIAAVSEIVSQVAERSNSAMRELRERLARGHGREVPPG